MRVLWVLVCLCVGGAAAAAPVHAQRALEASSLRARTPPAPMLILRPEAGLQELAQEVAAVLELRTGQRVQVGEAPPPGLLEAVPAGHVAMAHQEGAVLLVLGAPGGRSYDARVDVESLEDASAARAVALAAEDLRDTATELARGDDSNAEPLSAGADTQDVQGTGPGATATHRAAAAPVRDDGEDARAADDGFLGDVDPLFYARIYGGASTATESVASGIGSGVGLCVRGYCLFVAGELPLLSPRGDRLDVRYRYPTFISGFYARPLSFGSFTPGASIGFLTRLGHFEADMGGGDRSGIDTDLGARASLELAFEVLRGFDLMTEAGLDYTIDRNHVRAGDQLVPRGDRWSPWAQAALRFRP